MFVIFLRFYLSSWKAGWLVSLRRRARGGRPLYHEWSSCPAVSFNISFALARDFWRGNGRVRACVCVCVCMCVWGGRVKTLFPCWSLEAIIIQLCQAMNDPKCSLALILNQGCRETSFISLLHSLLIYILLLGKRWTWERSLCIKNVKLLIFWWVTCTNEKRLG